MKNDSSPSRRELLRNSLGLAGGLVALTHAVAEACGLTPAQTSGPFYPVSKITDESINDLTRIQGRTKMAKGEVVYISGTVTDESCKPITGALVEFWQAAASGRYNHPSDTSGLELDPDFQNWGEFLTDGEGKFCFKTIIPGHYPADTNWTRPPHIHVKVSKRGMRELVTQMYFTPNSFEGAKVALVEELNRKDSILQAVHDKDLVIVSFTRTTTATTVGPLVAYRQTGENVTLVKVGELVAAKHEKLGTFNITMKRG